MIRKIIKIDEKKCNGCGLCCDACHEGAIAIIDGKAKLIRDDYCDGLGNCLPVCPTGAITFEEREAAEFNEAAVLAQKNNNGCPGSKMQTIKNTEDIKNLENTEIKSQLTQWPVQIKLVPVNAPYFENSNLLIAADCTAYAYGDFHRQFIKNNITLIGCPKLDEGNYTDKLTEIFKYNNIKSITLVRMEVPCCGGIENAVKNALENCKKQIECKYITISIDGKIL